MFRRHDEWICVKNKRPFAGTASSGNASGGGGSCAPTSPVHSRLMTQQFGVSLQFIKDNNGGQVIPPIMRQCIEFLSTPDGLLTVL